MIMMYVYLILGFVLLIKGADYFVEGSSSVAKLLRVPGIVIGLTVVAFGTSAPELAVSMTASLAGNNEIAVGNVIGSNIFNLLVVVGACGLIMPLIIEKKILYHDFLFSIVVAVVLLAMLAFDRQIGRVDAAILLGFFAYFLFQTVKGALKNRVSKEEEFVALSPLKSAVFIIVGLAAIVWGGDLVVDSASAIAVTFGFSQTLIGLTIVAFGTSLPELVTSVVASKKGENGMALGNVIGSNIFNILFVLAASAAIHPIAVSVLSVYDLICLIVFSLIAWALAKSKYQVNRKEGIIMILMYVAYTIYIAVR